MGSREACPHRLKVGGKLSRSSMRSLPRSTSGTTLRLGHLRNMARFYFHIINDLDVPDDEGQELANLAAAHLRAIDYARDLASAAVRQGRLDLKHRIDIEDDTGKVLAKVTFADAIDVSN